MFKKNRSTLLFTAFSLLFSSLLITGLYDFSNKLNESSETWAKASNAYQSGSSSIYTLEETLEPGNTPDLLLYYALEGDSDFLKSAISEAEKALNALQTLKGVTEDSYSLGLIEHLERGFSELAAV